MRQIKHLVVERYLLSIKFSNLKFSRNFTILGSKLIVLSVEVVKDLVDSCDALIFRAPTISREANFENKQSHYSLYLTLSNTLIPFWQAWVHCATWE